MGASGLWAGGGRGGRIGRQKGSGRAGRGGGGEGEGQGGAGREAGPPQLGSMAGRKPILESELPLVTTALAEFCARDRALFILGLNTGFRISELLALNVGEVWDGERIRH